MALNYSHRPVFTVQESNFVSSLRRNGCFVDGVSESNGDGFGGNLWLSSHKSFDFGRERCDAGCSQESGGVDIIDLLPADPFGMNISTTVTAISGWLEDLDFSYNNCCESDFGGPSGGESTLLAGLNLFWSNAMRFRTFLGSVDRCGDGTHDAAVPGGGGVGGCLGEVSGNVGFGSCGREGSVSCDGSVVDYVGSPYEGCSVSSDRGSNDVDDGMPHLALIFALGYLGLQDLLSAEMVCRNFRSTIVNDPLLWRSIHVDQSLNEKITDDVLLQLTSRAQGNLQSLTLVECPRITDNGLKLVLQSNPRLTKLSVPGCTRLSIEGIVSSLNASKSVGTPPLKQLRVGGIYGVTHRHFEELKSMLNVDNDVQHSDQEPRFYQRGNFYLSGVDDRAIDVEVCPKCQNVRLVYDCPADGCQVTENNNQICRACTLCIARCVQCGRCIDDSEYEETFCLELLCSGCGV